VAVIGMNTDSKEEDAQFVIDKMALNYPTLKATGLPEKYNVRGFPTLVILDQEGVIRDFHVGYSPKLKQDVIESIDKLLATPPAVAAP
jgi:thioredoxin-related protein